MGKIIPVSRPVLIKADIDSVNKSLKKGWISSDGPEIKEFEKNFSKLIQQKYSACVSNGTAALEIAIKALNIGKGDEVIIPNFTIVSNAIAVLKQNAKIVPIDCDFYSWNILVELIKKKITKKTKAIIATHIYGYPCEIDKIKEICKAKKIFLIEDAAEFIGHKYNQKPCGSFGDISTFSFYANKQITTGEGGLIATNNKTLYNKITSLRNLCFGKINRFNHEDIGWNYRMSNIQAALGINQLKRIDKIVKKKKEIGKLYYKLLKNNKNIYIQRPSYKNFENIYWIVGIVILDKKILASKLKKKLIKYGIETRPFFWPMNKQKFLKKLNINIKGNFKNSEYISKYGLYLPSSINISKNQILKICNIVNNVI
jgi:perosamine synthetase